MKDTISNFSMSSTGSLADQPLPKINDQTQPISESGQDTFIADSRPDYGLNIYSESNPEKVDAAATTKFMFDTKPLDECIQQAENLKDLLHSDAMALKVIGILSYGLRKSGELLAEAIYNYKIARSNRKHAEALAALEGFNQYLADNKSLKATDTTRTHYMSLDPSVLKACEREAFYEAMVSQLETYKMQFTMVLSAIKGIIAKQKADGMIDGSDIGISIDG